jgi:hypothetical protein
MRRVTKTYAAVGKAPGFAIEDFRCGAADGTKML